MGSYGNSGRALKPRSDREMKSKGAKPSQIDSSDLLRATTGACIVRCHPRTHFTRRQQPCKATS